MARDYENPARYRTARKKTVEQCPCTGDDTVCSMLAPSSMGGLRSQDPCGIFQVDEVDGKCSILCPDHTKSRAPVGSSCKCTIV
ncbi:hypothetical protein BDA96_01G106200 [Sorghum bicolor]|uniref:Uncharacterized protein n=2 Tax=Sorghum bicolor TaxID=4558 RepID=A0A921RWB2_SORBI|nr:hypothetical protein BDA96_01G106200 [Sorghum bicolor]OQU91047.1 hypothetical protein SORBI_3001G102150 [Sorghum bicolor]